MRRTGECGVDGDRRRGWRFGEGGRRPENLQHKDEGGRRRLEEHDGRRSGTELYHEDEGATPAKRSGKEYVSTPQAEVCTLFLPFFPFGERKERPSGFPNGGRPDLVAQYVQADVGSRSCQSLYEASSVH